MVVSETLPSIHTSLMKRSAYSCLIWPWMKKKKKKDRKKRNIRGHGHKWSYLHRHTIKLIVKHYVVYNYKLNIVPRVRSFGFYCLSHLLMQGSLQSFYWSLNSIPCLKQLLYHVCGNKKKLCYIQQKSYVICGIQLFCEGLVLVSHWYNCCKEFSFPVQVYEAHAYRIKTGWRRTKVVVKVSSFKCELSLLIGETWPYPLSLHLPDWKPVDIICWSLFMLCEELEWNLKLAYAW